MPKITCAKLYTYVYLNIYVYNCILIYIYIIIFVVFDYINIIIITIIYKRWYKLSLKLLNYTIYYYQFTQVI